MPVTKVRIQSRVLHDIVNFAAGPHAFRRKIICRPRPGSCDAAWEIEMNGSYTELCAF